MMTVSKKRIARERDYAACKIYYPTPTLQSEHSKSTNQHGKTGLLEKQVLLGAVGVKWANC